MNNDRFARLPWLASSFLAILLLASAHRADGGEVAKATYGTGYQSVTEIGANLCGALDPKRRQQLRPQPLLLEQLNVPCVAPGQSSEGATDSQTVQVSAGFVQLLNQLSHAKAIEETEKGFVKKYASVLARETGDHPLAPLPATAGQDPWDADTVNYQVGNFNQMAGALVAIDLAHHYLGHVKKYSRQLTAGQSQPVPINSVLTEKEWHEAVMKGAKNALDCGYGVDGLRCVFECFNNMPSRPPWAAYFIHAKADVSKINRELTKLEKDFFLVGK